MREEEVMISTFYQVYN